MRIAVFALASGLLLVACNVTNTDFPVRTKASRAEVAELGTSVEIVKLTAANITAYSTPRNLEGGRASLPSGGWDYRIGVGDVLDISVFDHPELTQSTSLGRSVEQAGQRVQADGTFFFPYVGQVPARGKTPEAVRDDLTKRLEAYVPDPQVDVRVVGYKSQSVSVTGEVKAPAREPLTDSALTLLEAIDAAGGLTEQADPRTVTIRRGGKTHRVDLEAFLKQGVSQNNPVLQPGDVVTVSRLKVQEAYLLGQMEKPMTIDLARENVTLTQAIARAAGLNEDSADARGIFVFRDGAQGITVFQLDARNATAYLIGTKFVLQPQDVIYVTSAPVYRWNRLISGLVPTVTVVKTANTIN